MPRPKKSSRYKATRQSWYNMLRRCYVDTHVSYKDYGGRGITVCDRWRCPQTGFEAFLEDMGTKPSLIHQLDRKDSNGHYNYQNCQWATPVQQGVNKRNTVYVTHPTTGARIAAATLAKEMGLTYQQLRYRFKEEGKWNDGKAVETDAGS